MRVLFVAPLPPPATGHSLASQVLLDDLTRTHQVRVIDLSRDSQNDGGITPKRSIAVARSLGGILKKRAGVDAIYLTISESVAGNVKDLFVYLLCAGRLSRVFIHLHGGSIGRLLFERFKTLHRLNHLFVQRFGGVIVSGKSHVPIFEGMIDRDKIHVVPNFAQDHLFVQRDAIEAKFARTSPIRMLYISAMTRLKGFDVLTDGYLQLSERRRRELRIDFAGQFPSRAEEEQFRRKIERVEGLCYHGVVDDDAKRRMFADAHVFCLPTAHLEGQPISILEAYASGCVVLATVPSGIRDIFTSLTNGYAIEPRSVPTMRETLENLVTRRGDLLSIALRNRDIAEHHYRTSIYATAIRRILERRVHAEEDN